MRALIVFLFLVLFVSFLGSADAVIVNDCSSARYTYNMDGTMTDCRTGLIWLQEANCKSGSNSVTPSVDGKLSWYDAMKWVKGLKTGICGLTDGSVEGDWRLPTKTEFMAMITSAKKQGLSFPTLTNAASNAQWIIAQPNDFQNVQNWFYWTSSTEKSTESNAYEVYLGTGNAQANGKLVPDDHTWPVRAGQTESRDSLRLE